MRFIWRNAPGLLAATAILVATLFLTGPSLRPSDQAQNETPPSTTASGIAPVPSETPPAEVLARAVERVTRGASPMPYFAEPAEAAQFLELWYGRLPEGKVLVAMADAFNAGAEAGHLVPVRLYLDSGSRVLCLTGEAGVKSSPQGNRIRRLTLTEEPLLVDSWAAATGRLKAAVGVVPKVAAAPFYGRFRFTVGDRHYAVDAASGEVILE